MTMQCNKNIYLWCTVLILAAFVQSEEDVETYSETIVESTPKFKSIPTTVKTFENSTVVLPCYLENAGTTYHVRWLKDKHLLADSSDEELIPPDRVKLYSNHSIQVTRLTPNDTGEYVCEVIRKEQSMIRQVHAIEVLYPAEVVSIPEIGLVQVRIGEMIEMGCKTAGVPSPIVTWLYNGQPMELLVNRQKLRFNATSTQLSGTYECMAINGVGDPARATIQLVVMNAPTVFSPSPWVHTALGLSSTLECVVESAPAARVHWFHGHAPVVVGGRTVAHVRGDRYQLLIRSVRDVDLGAYTCKAENRLGMAEAFIFLSGVANVAVFKTDPSKNIPTTTTFTLIWVVDSYSPIIEYNLWFRPYKQRPPQKDGVVMIKDKDDTWTKMTIPGENNEGPVHTAFYVLRGLTPATAYEAQVISRNRYGWSKPSSIFHFFTRDGVADSKMIEKSMFSPAMEEGFLENAILKTSVSDFYATAESDKIYSTPAEESNLINAANIFTGSHTNCIALLSICFRFLWG